MTAHFPGMVQALRLMEFHSTLILLKYQYTVNMPNLCEFVFLAKKKNPDFFTLYRSACTMPGK
jgi:hypothetical protein